MRKKTCGAKGCRSSVGVRATKKGPRCAAHDPARAEARLEASQKGVAARRAKRAAALVGKAAFPMDGLPETSLRRMFTLAVEAGRVAVAPVIKTPNPRNVRQGFLEEKELQAVLAKLPAWARAPVTFMALTGWRSNSEVLPLRWKENVDQKAKIVRLEPGT